MNPSAQPSPTDVTNPDAQTPETEALPGDSREALEAASAIRSAWLGPKGERISDMAVEFNRYPTRYAHPSWMPDGWASWAGRMADGGILEARLGEALLREWNLDARPCFDFAAPARRLALLDPVPLRRAVLLVGLARHAEEISRLMERERVRELKEQVGDAAYRFVTQRAPLLAGPLTSGANTAGAGKGWTVKALAAGMGMLGVCLGPDSEGLASRLLVKFPRECAPYLEAGGGQGTPESYMRLFRKVLAKEVDPKWDDMLS